MSKADRIPGANPPHPVILRMAELLARIEFARAQSRAVSQEAEKARADAAKPAEDAA